MKRAILYARRSSERNDDAYTLTSQLAACRAYAEQAGMVVTAELSEEVTGTIHIKDRPRGSEAWRLLAGHEADALIVYRIHWFSRADLVDTLGWVRDVIQLGAELYALELGAVRDVNDISLVIHGWSSGVERVKIVERLSRGRLQKAKSGKIVGSGGTFFWMDKTGKGSDSVFTLNDRVSVVRDIFGMVIGGEKQRPIGLHSIVKRLNDAGVPAPSSDRWSVQKVARIVHTPAVKGLVNYGAVEIDRAELRIISDADFDRAQVQIARNTSQSKRNRKKEYLAAGRLKCWCGYAMRGLYRTYRDRVYEYYTCGRTDDRHEYKYWQRGPIDAALWLFTVESINGVYEDVGDELERQMSGEVESMRLGELEAGIAAERLRIDRLVARFGNETDEDMARAADAQIASAKKKRDEYQRERSELLRVVNDKGERAERRQEVIDKLEEYRRLIDGAGYALRREIMGALNVAGRMTREGELMARCDVAGERAVKF